MFHFENNPILFHCLIMHKTSGTFVCTTKIDMGNSKHTLNNCLYFNANSLARNISKLADDAFRVTGLSPSHAFVLMLVNDNPESTQSEIAKYMKIAPSTVTRFIDQLERKKNIFRKVSGKTTFLSPTEEGKRLNDTIKSAWKNLYDTYSEILTKEFADSVSKSIQQVNTKLNESV